MYNYDISFINSLCNIKIARHDFIAEFYEHGENNRFYSYMYTDKQYSSFFQSYTHQTYKEIQNKKCDNSKLLCRLFLLFSRGHADYIRDLHDG